MRMGDLLYSRGLSTRDIHMTSFQDLYGIELSGLKMVSRNHQTGILPEIKVAVPSLNPIYLLSLWTVSITRSGRGQGSSAGSVYVVLGVTTEGYMKIPASL